LATSPSSARNNSASPKSRHRTAGALSSLSFLFFPQHTSSYLCCTIFPYGTASYYASYDFAYGAIRSIRMHHTGVGIQSFIYLSLYLLPTTLFSAFHSGRFGAFCTHASLFFTRPVDQLPTHLARLFLMALAMRHSASEKSCHRGRAKSQSGRSVYTRLLRFLLRVCLRSFFHVCLFRFGICWR
jgi:hypothetical protein